MSTLDLERTLNPEQVAAVTHGDGPQLVLAGAGSGKTRVITHRIAWLVEERRVDPERIVAVTFTNKAAGEMRERVEELLGLYPLPTFVGTFHRYALRLLRRYGERIGLRRDFAIVDAADQQSLMKKALSAEGLSESAFPPRSMLAAISGAKNRLLKPAEYEARAESFFDKKVAQVYRRYQGLLAGMAGVDFDDMLALGVALLRDDAELGERLRRRVEHLLVDEYQDTNHAQLVFIRELIGPTGNLTAVGDEDQGIYRWRGADLDNILDFEKSFPGATVRKLERNYRSTQNILDAAGDLVAHNQRRRGKRLWTEAGKGEPLTLYLAADEGDEAAWIVGTIERLRGRVPLGGFAVLVRTNAQTRALEDVLMREAIPYSLVGAVRFYERAEIKDLVAYLRVMRNPRDDFSLLRILNQPPRGIGKGTQELLERRAAELGQPLWDVLALDELGTLPQRSAKALGDFRDLLIDLRRAAGEMPLPALLDFLLERTGYRDLYRSGDEEDEARLENVRELVSAAQEFTERRAFRSDEEDLLTAFLDHVALVADLDSWEGTGGAVSLMTLHSAKGLEFPVVFVSGLEEGVLPHFNAGLASDDLEEERRLLYVGMTRARERLFLTSCRRRRIAGRYQDQRESSFLAEIPMNLVNVVRSSALLHEAGARDVYRFFGRDPGGPMGGLGFGGGGGARPGGGGYGGERRAPNPAAVAASALPASGGRNVRKGSRVRHPTLGVGVVLDLEGTGDDGKLTVYFDKAGKRKLLARYANLEGL